MLKESNIDFKQLQEILFARKRQDQLLLIFLFK
jgi:hypothetical protein